MTLRPLAGQGEGQLLERRQIVFDVGDDEALEGGISPRPADHRVEGAYSHQGFGAGIAQLVGEGCFVEKGIGQHHHRPDFQRPIVGDDRLGNVGQQQHHPVALLHAQSLQAQGEAVGRFVEFPIADAPPVENQGRSQSVAAGRAF